MRRTFERGVRARTNRARISEKAPKLEAGRISKERPLWISMHNREDLCGVREGTQVSAAVLAEDVLDKAVDVW